MSSSNGAAYVTLTHTNPAIAAGVVDYATNLLSIIQGNNTNIVYFTDSSASAINVAWYGNGAFGNPVDVWTNGSGSITNDGGDYYYNKSGNVGIAIAFPVSWTALTGGTAPTGTYETNFTTNATINALALAGGRYLLLQQATNVIYVNPNAAVGNDTVWRRGDPQFPMLSLNAAASVAVSNDVIRLMEGDFPITNAVTMVRGVSLVGSGKGVSRIRGTGGSDRGILFAGNVFLDGFSTTNGPIGISASGVTDNAILNDLDVNGIIDGLLFTGASFNKVTVWNSRIHSFFDLVVTESGTGTLELRNCQLVAEKSGSISDEIRAILPGACLVRMEGGSITISNGATTNVVVQFNNADGRVEMWSTDIKRGSTNSTSRLVTGAAGTLSGCFYDNGAFGCTNGASIVGVESLVYGTNYPGVGGMVWPRSNYFGAPNLFAQSEVQILDNNLDVQHISATDGKLTLSAATSVVIGEGKPLVANGAGITNIPATAVPNALTNNQSTPVALGNTLTVSGNTTNSGTISVFPNGSSGNPSIAFAAAPTSGFGVVSGDIRITRQGADATRIGSARLSQTTEFALGADPSSSDVFFTRTAAGNLTIGTNVYMRGSLTVSNTVSPTNGILWQSGVQLTNAYTVVTNIDFASLVSIGCEDTNITVTGAAVGDVVSLGVANAAVPSATSFYTAWVSAADTVTLRYCALVSGDPASGAFRIQVNKWK